MVTTDVEHYGLLGPLAASGVAVSLARIRDRPPADAFDAISALVTSRTRLIAVSHVAWSTGHVLPLAELVATGVPVLVDGAQSAGAIPVDVAALGCDFYTVSGQKWLLGPDTTGGLFVHPRQRDALMLSMPSYFGRTDHDELGEPVDAPGATKFDAGSVPLPSLAHSLSRSSSTSESARHGSSAPRSWRIVAASCFRRTSTWLPSRATRHLSRFGRPRRLPQSSSG